MEKTQFQRKAKSEVVLNKIIKFDCIFDIKKIENEAISIWINTKKFIFFWIIDLETILTDRHWKKEKF